MKIWGIGPKIVRAGFLGLAVTIPLSYLFPSVFRVAFVPRGVSVSVGCLVLTCGLVLWIAGVRTVARAFRKGRLVTSGPFAVVRHPIYSAYIVFIVPAVAIFLRSWLVLLVPVAMAFEFWRLIHVEDEYLLREFGDTFRAYRDKVPALIPFTKLKK